MGDEDLDVGWEDVVYSGQHDYELLKYIRFDPTATAQVANHRLKNPSIISFRLGTLELFAMELGSLHLHNGNSIGPHVARRLDIRD